MSAVKDSGREDSNLRPPVPKTGALARLSYAPITKTVALLVSKSHDYVEGRTDQVYEVSVGVKRQINDWPSEIDKAMNGLQRRFQGNGEQPSY